MNILVVDEEPRVAEALARVLSDLEPTWELRSARSTQEALVALSERPCDVILTELRGAGLEGASLLSRVAVQQPRAVRLVLSGRHDHDAAFELLPLAHQLLPKPCAAETLHQVLTRVAELTGLLSDRRLQTLASEPGFLPSPRALLRDLGGASGGSVRPLFRADPALATALMQLASSGFLCSSSKVADIDGALQQLGAEWTERIAGALVAAQDTGPGHATTEAALLNLQSRSRRVARVAARLTHLPEDSAAAYLAGLLCDVGQLALERAAPERRHLTRAQATKLGATEHAVELETWGATHAELGAYLLGLRGLPFQVVEAVAHHHAPTRAAADSIALTRLVWLAACVVDAEVPDAEAVAQLEAEELYLQAQQSLRAVLLDEQRERD